MNERRRGTKLHSVWILLSLAAPPCQESNPDFDGAASTTAATGNTDAGTTQTTQTTQTSNGETTSSVADSGGTSTGSVDGSTTATSGVADSGSTSTTGGGMGSDSTGPCEMCGTTECVDLMTDDNHCGMCDHKCPGQQVCIMGDCMIN